MDEIVLVIGIGLPILSIVAIVWWIENHYYKKKMNRTIKDLEDKFTSSIEEMEEKFKNESK